jgi:hypothetical protein
MSSITAFRYDFRPIKRGFDFSWEFHWFDSAGEPLDLAGCTVSCVVWDRKKELELISLAVEYVSLDPGHTSQSLTPAQTAILVGSLPYELRLLEPDNSYHCYMDGLMPFVDFSPP